MNWRLTLTEILELLETDEIRGSYTGEVSGFADLREAQAGDLSFLTGGKYTRFLAESRASVILVPSGQPGTPADNQAWIPVPDPSDALAILCNHVESLLLPPHPTGIHPSAVVDPEARVDESASIGPHCYVGPNATVGKGTVLESCVRVDRGAQIGEDCHLFHGVMVGWGCQVGNRCRLMGGVIIGSDGFGYHSDASGHRREPQIGVVIIEDDVDIGSNSCVDRARFAATRVGRGTKIDNLVQVGHNNIVGKHNILCAQTGLAGSNTTGDFCIFAGQCGLSGHIRLGKGVTVSAQAGVTKDLKDGEVVSGMPARPHKEEMKSHALLRRLPDLSQRIKALEKALKEARP